MKNSEKLYFIVGMPRAGTTFLSTLLNEHEEVCSTGETLFFGRFFIPPHDGINYNKRQISDLLKRFKTIRYHNSSQLKIQNIYDNLDEEFEKLGDFANPRQVFGAFGDAFKLAQKKSVFIEKTPHHIQYTDRILNFFPETKFIVLMRDPYEWMLSYKFQGSQKSTELRSIFKKIYHPITAALVWKKNYYAINRLKKYQSSQYLILKKFRINKY